MSKANMYQKRKWRTTLMQSKMMMPSEEIALAGIEPLILGSVILSRESRSSR
jgi:hypothetical protein